jgi:hypothetical protein
MSGEGTLTLKHIFAIILTLSPRQLRKKIGDFTRKWRSHDFPLPMEVARAFRRRYRTLSQLREHIPNSVDDTILHLR